MPATGTEVVKLSQLLAYKNSVDTALGAKADSSAVPSFPLSVANGGTGSTTASGALSNLGALAAPSSTGTSGQVLTWNGSATTWTTPSEGTTYTGTSPITVSGSVISIAEAGDGTQGTVAFASDSDFSTYMGLS